MQKADISCGRITDGSNSWGFFPVPTPGASNSTLSYSGWVDQVPEFSVLGGLFNNNVTLAFSTPFEGVIRYTTDGSEPTGSSARYTSPISITSTTVVRARIFVPDKIAGTIVTHSYFLRENFEDRNLPVISIATDPENFWDPETGIYVQDFKPEWEVPINIELFENDGSDRASFNEMAGTKINGLNSWELPQKMLGIYFRKKYGTSKLEYPLFNDRQRSVFKSFALRASGSDWSYTLFRDGLAQRATQLNMSNDAQGFRPCIVYINGEYLGIHNIRSKVDEDFIARNHDLEPGTFDMVENEDFAETGDLSAYNQLISLYSKDLSIQSNFDQVAAILDIENFTDFMVTEICVRNSSLNHNVMAWKPKGEGKWKWILVDLDRGFFSPNNYLLSFYITQDVVPLDDLLENQGYKNYFGRRLADQLYTTFNAERMGRFVDEHQAWIENEIPNHIARWEGTTSSYGDAIPSVDYWYEEVCKLKDFAQIRPQVILSDLQSLGFDEPANLLLSVFPAQGGKIYLNNLEVPGESCLGGYPKNLSIQLEAKNKPGYRFAGWKEALPQTIISKGSAWHYLDIGSYPGNSWYLASFNDGSWSTGNGELGYGDGDEQTVISYGGNSSNKYITSYFRKTFTLNPGESLPAYLLLNLLSDDGAVIYLNGNEILRSNMGCGDITYSTLAVSALGEPSESEYFSFKINSDYLVQGENVLAAEIHQASVNSSDVSFDLELLAYFPASSNYVSTSPGYNIALTNDRSLVACFEENGQCILPEQITEDLTLSKECSPYVAQSDITIEEGAVLFIEEGVEIWMPEEASIFVHGSIQATGTEEQRIIIRANPANSGNSWGCLCFDYSDQPSGLSYISLEDASGGPVAYRDVAAISCFHATVKMDHLIIENVARNPISARYSDITLTDSRLHSEVTGDLINVKYGKAVISHCVFEGNDQPDTDAIDYDDVENGVINNSIIFNFYGSNSDGIDIGEKAEQIRIDSVWIYNITDKGVSVGQQSTVSIENCIFNNCTMAVGLKDSCRVTIDNCTFYGNATTVSCFEKNPGSAGGNGILRNSILSNSYDGSYFADKRSTLKVSYSLSDNDTLPYTGTNLFGNPLFESPTYSDFALLPNSPCLGTGNNNGQTVNLGSMMVPEDRSAYLLINHIFYNQQNAEDKSEFFSIHNPTSETIDLTGYQITRGVEYVFPDNVMISPEETIFLVKDITAPPANYYNGKVFQWEKGSLANEGETIRLQDRFGIIQDQVDYLPVSPWPVPERRNDVLNFENHQLDNHFGENWKIADYNTFVSSPYPSISAEILVFPNPTHDLVHIQAPETTGRSVSVYSITGQLMKRFQLNESGYAQVHLSQFNTPLVLIAIDNQVYKVIILPE